MSKNSLLIIGNWKMHKTIQEAVHYFHAIQNLIPQNHDPLYLAVPYTTIKTLADLALGSSIVVGAQNISPHEEGAYTGEISGKMVKEAGAQFTLIGHSERRQQFHEDEHIHLKIERALTNGLQPILCIGESHEERKTQQTRAILQKQLKEALKNSEAKSINRLVVAYEPVWAIGSSQAATPEIIQETLLFCRQILQESFGESAEQIALLYGGAVTPDNVSSMAILPNVQGFLVGTASLLPESFAKIICVLQN